MAPGDVGAYGPGVIYQHPLADASPHMLAVARSRVPGADFEQGSLQALPLADDSGDLVVSGLALSHLPSLDEVMEEFAPYVVVWHFQLAGS